MTVPVEVREVLGKVANVQTLYTHDLNEAKILRDFLVKKATEEVQNARKSVGATPGAARRSYKRTVYREAIATVNQQDKLTDLLRNYQDQIPSADPQQMTSVITRLSHYCPTVEDVSAELVLQFIEKTSDRAGGKAKLLEFTRAFLASFADDFGTNIASRLIDIKVPREGRIKRVPWLKEQFEELVRYAEDPLKGIIEICYYEKMKPSEVLKGFNDGSIADRLPTMSLRAKAAVDRLSSRGSSLSVGSSVKLPQLDTLNVQFSKLKVGLGYGPDKTFTGLAHGEGS